MKDYKTIIVPMGAYYDEIEIEDMAWDEEKGVFHYPCPCGDRFEISRKQLANCEDIATCPSCSLIIRVIYDPVRSLIKRCYTYDSNNRSLILRTSRPMMRTPMQVSRKKTMRWTAMAMKTCSKTRWRI